MFIYRFSFRAGIPPKANGCVYTDKHGNIMIKILAKPGAKHNQITGIYN